MRKRIGVFIGEIAQDYQRIVANSIMKKANKLGYDVVFICSYGSYNEDRLYAEGERASVNFPDFSSFSGIIATEDVFDNAGMPEALYKNIKDKAKCPTVYLRSTREGCYSVLLEDKLSIENMTRHFVEDHGFTDLCYMSGKKEAEDAKDRLAGFVAVLEEHGIEVKEHMIYHGNYWMDCGEAALEWFMEGRSTYPQAIICANDYMALGICGALRKRGIRIPQDVCVSGFDFLDEGKSNVPTLTSLEVDFEKMVDRAVEIIHSVNQGNAEERIQRVPAKMRLQKSCGCGKQYRYKNVVELMNIRRRLTDDTKNTLMSVTDYQYSFTYQEYMSVAGSYRRFVKSDKIYICLCDKEEKEYEAADRDSAFTERVQLNKIFVGESKDVDVNITFPRRKILPDEFWKEEEPNNLFVFTLHFKNKIYGYIVAEAPKKQWFDIYTQGYFMTLANAIENAEAHSKMEQLESIRAIYQNDALTGILNRRGFDKLLQERFSKVRMGENNIGIVSVDMDNLKVINDTYGHAEGDKALIAIANALSAVMREGDFCARIGGDEYAAVINLTDKGRSTQFKKDFAAALEAENKYMSQYKVGASVGICETSDPEATSLMACIQIADKRMYEEKKSKKVGRK